MKLTSVEYAALFNGLDWGRIISTQRIPTPTLAGWNRGAMQPDRRTSGRSSDIVDIVAVGLVRARPYRG